MTKKYDAIIVGAGPGGAMAAKTAAEVGLKTAVLERKTDPALITRGCAMMFVSERDPCFAEKMYYSEKDARMVFPVNGFSVDYDGPCRNFYAWHIYAPDGTSRVRFGDYEANRKMGDQGRLSFVFDKGYLIDGIIKAALKNGADLFTGVNVEAVEKTTNGLRVAANGEVFEAPFVIGADGLNSRVAELMGFNKERAFYGSHPKLTYYATGINAPESESLILAGLSRPGAERPTSFFLLPSIFADDEYWFAIPTSEDFDYLITQSVYSEWFRDIEVSRRLAYVYTLRAPVAEPYKDNVLLVGDSAWFAEAEITGSMMCGWKAANSVAIALRDGKPNREGVKDYIEWWRRSYPDFFDYRDLLMLFIFYNGFLTVAEMSYLFGLFKQPLHATLNPFLLAKLIKAAAKPMMPQIQKEMPSLVEKLNMLEVDNIDELLGGES